MTEIVLMADPRITAIPVEDCGQPLVDLSRREFIRIDRRKADTTGDWVAVRTGVAERLAHAATRLPDRLRLLHIEGYRPPHLQARYFTAYRERLTGSRPELTDAQLHHLASRYVSPPEIAPHSAGAAIDITLCTESGQELDMGTRVNATPEDSDYACYTAASTISSAARHNRAILVDALTDAGLINYPTEWWHWSYGDRYWALHTGHPAALYGPTSRDRQQDRAGTIKASGRSR